MKERMMRWMLALALFLAPLASAQLDNVANFAKANVSQGYDAAATEIIVATGKGALFPASGFNVVWWNVTDYPDPSDDPNREIVRVTTRTGDTFTITRAQEGTSATTKNTGGKTYRVILAATAKSFSDIGTALSTKASATSFPVVITIACSDEATTLTASTSVPKVTCRAPYAFTLTGIRANVTTAPTGTAILVDVHESGTSVLSTKCMIDTTELTSVTATTAYEISDSAIADDAQLAFFVDQIGSAIAGKGLKVTLYGTRALP